MGQLQWIFLRFVRRAYSAHAVASFVFYDSIHKTSILYLLSQPTFCLTVHINLDEGDLLQKVLSSPTRVARILIK